MQLFAVRRPGVWAKFDEVSVAASRSAHIGDRDMADRIRWIRSYVIEEANQRIGSLCIYLAEDEAAIREHAKRVGMAGNMIVPIVDTIVVRPDPQ